MLALVALALDGQSDQRLATTAIARERSIGQWFRQYSTLAVCDPCTTTAPNIGGLNAYFLASLSLADSASTSERGPGHPSRTCGDDHDRDDGHGDCRNRACSA